MPHKDRDERLEYLRKWKERNRPSPTVKGQRRRAPVRTSAGILASALPPFGVMVFSPDGTEVQCHVCGEWFGSITSHMKAHGLTAVEYKEAFGLPRTISTLPPATAEKQRQAAIARDQGAVGRQALAALPPGKGREPGQEARLGVRIAASEARKGIYTRGGEKARKSE